MFNTNSNKTTIDAPTQGIIQRTNEKSFFLIMHYNSELSSEIFASKPKYRDKDISILQVLLMVDGRIMVEIVNTVDL